MSEPTPTVKTIWYCSASGVIEDGACPSHTVCPKGSQYMLLVPGVTFPELYKFLKAEWEESEE